MSMGKKSPKLPWEQPCSLGRKGFKLLWKAIMFFGEQMCSNFMTLIFFISILIEIFLTTKL